MLSPDMDKLRGVVIGLSDGGKKEINNALIFNALALGSEPEKARVRRQLGDMVHRKELARTKAGHYRYNPQAQPQRQGDGYVRMWRAVRASRGVFLLAEIAAVSHVDTSTVGKYVTFLLESGHVRRNGKRKNVLQFSVTAQGRELRETPFPPVAIRDPFADERAAMSRLARVFFEKDLYSAAARKAVITECRTILQRFDTQDEEGGDHGDA